MSRKSECYSSKNHSTPTARIMVKGKEKEPKLKELPALGSAKEQDKKEAIPSSSNSKSNVKTESKGPKKDLPIPIPFQVRQGSHKERVRFDVIPYLK